VSFKLWTLLSYSLLHNLADFFHLFFNLLLIYFFGPTLEGRWGSRRFVIFYFSGALGGGLAFIAFNLLLGSGALLVGASGAVLALIIAWGILFPNLPVYLFGVLPLKGKHLILLTVGVELLLAVSQTPVSSAAHFGGMATGALLVTGYWRPSKLWARLGFKLKVPIARKGRRKTPKFTVVINPDDDDKAPPGGWVH
jgi:membrane associated rhomboid family serine protease